MKVNKYPVDIPSFQPHQLQQSIEAPTFENPEQYKNFNETPQNVYSVYNSKNMNTLQRSDYGDFSSSKKQNSNEKSKEIPIVKFQNESQNMKPRDSDITLDPKNFCDQKTEVRTETKNECKSKLNTKPSNDKSNIINKNSTGYENDEKNKPDNFEYMLHDLNSIKKQIPFEINTESSLLQKKVLETKKSKVKTIASGLKKEFKDCINSPQNQSPQRNSIKAGLSNRSKFEELRQEIDKNHGENKKIIKQANNLKEQAKLYFQKQNYNSNVISNREKRSKILTIKSPKKKDTNFSYTMRNESKSYGNLNRFKTMQGSDDANDHYVKSIDQKNLKQAKIKQSDKVFNKNINLKNHIQSSLCLKAIKINMRKKEVDQELTREVSIQERSSIFKTPINNDLNTKFSNSGSKREGSRNVATFEILKSNSRIKEGSTSKSHRGKNVQVQIKGFIKDLGNLNQKNKTSNILRNEISKLQKSKNNIQKTASSQTRIQNYFITDKSDKGKNLNKKYVSSKLNSVSDLSYNNFNTHKNLKLQTSMNSGNSSDILMTSLNDKVNQKTAGPRLINNKTDHQNLFYDNQNRRAAKDLPYAFGLQFSSEQNADNNTLLMDSKNRISQTLKSIDYHTKCIDNDAIYKDEVNEIMLLHESLKDKIKYLQDKAKKF